MIKDLITKIKEELKLDYVTRYDILHNSLTQEEIRLIWINWKLNNSDLVKVRKYVIWLEWDENNSSFEEWMLVWLENLQKELKALTKNHFYKIKQNVSEDFILWMIEILKLIK
jgi:hypothetical protein